MKILIIDDEKIILEKLKMYIYRFYRKREASILLLTMP